MRRWLEQHGLWPVRNLELLGMLCAIGALILMIAGAIYFVWHW